MVLLLPCFFNIVLFDEFKMELSKIRGSFTLCQPLSFDYSILFS